MKVRISILMMMCVAMLAFSACSDDNNDSIKVPESISQALLAKYPAATQIEWEQKGNYFVADCKMDGKEMEVWFNAKAEWQLTEVDINWNDLPETVQTDFMGGEYATWEREDIDWLQYPSQPMVYVIEVEKGNTDYQLFYSEEGNLLEKKDVTGKDDTHWPK